MLADRFRMVARDGDPQALSFADEQRHLSRFALHLPHQVEVYQPVPVDAGQRASERRLDGSEAQIDVERAALAMDEREPIGRLEGPDFFWIEEDQVPLLARHHPERSGAALGPARRQPPQALLDALLAERLEQVVDDAEVERLE